MKPSAFSYLAQTKVRNQYRRLAGARIQDLISLNVNNASEIARSYSHVRAHTFTESGQTAFTEPTHLPEDKLAIAQPFSVKCESVVLEIDNPEFSFRNHLLLDGKLNVLFTDLSPREDVVAFREYAPVHVLKKRGTIAYLSNTWVDNYYHWMQLTLPLMRIYQKLGPKFQPDYYYIGESQLQDVQRESLERLGIPSSKIIRQACRGDRLIAGMVLHRPQHAGARYRDEWGHKFIREMFLPVRKDPSSPKRIYVKRGDARMRRILNETELSNYLEPRGFALTVGAKSVAEQAHLFSNAEFIIGAHGAALTNVLFASEGAKLIEIFPEGLEESSFFTAATYSKLDYSYLFADRVGAHMRVNIPKLARLLQINGV
jgi:hypothetical protein